jgi:hypothetical protein
MLYTGDDKYARLDMFVVDKECNLVNFPVPGHVQEIQVHLKGVRVLSTIAGLLRKSSVTSAIVFSINSDTTSFAAAESGRASK